jgi:hypothetical protein
MYKPNGFENSKRILNESDTRVAESVVEIEKAINELGRQLTSLGALPDNVNRAWRRLVDEGNLLGEMTSRSETITD